MDDAFIYVKKPFLHHRRQHSFLNNLILNRDLLYTINEKQVSKFVHSQSYLCQCSLDLFFSCACLELRRTPSESMVAKSVTKFDDASIDESMSRSDFVYINL